MRERLHRRKCAKFEAQRATMDDIGRAAERAGITKKSATLFLSYYAEALTDRLLRGHIVHVPNLFYCAIVLDNRGRHALKVCTDRPVRLALRERLASTASTEAFRRLVYTMCVGLYARTAGPRTYATMLAAYRRKITKTEDIA